MDQLQRSELPFGDSLYSNKYFSLTGHSQNSVSKADVIEQPTTEVKQPTETDTDVESTKDKADEIGMGFY